MCIKYGGKIKFKVLYYEVLTNLSNLFLPLSTMGPFAPLTRVDDLMSLHLPSLPPSHTIILTRCPLLRPFLHLPVLQGPAQVPCFSQALPDKPSLGSSLLSPCSFSHCRSLIQKIPTIERKTESPLETFQWTIYSLSLLGAFLSLCV